MEPIIVVALIGGFATVIAAVVAAYRAGRTSRENQAIQRDTLDLAVMQATVATLQTLGDTQGKAMQSLQDRVNYLEANWQPKEPKRD